VKFNSRAREDGQTARGRQRTREAQVRLRRLEDQLGQGEQEEADIIQAALVTWREGYKRLIAENKRQKTEYFVFISYTTSFTIQILFE